MVTLNLLPDIKKEYIKAKRTKSMILMTAFFVSAGSIAVVALMSIYVFGVQKLQISNSQGSIDESVRVLTETEDLAKIVTVQNQLSALPSLQDGTIAASRLFDYLGLVTPNDVTLNQVNIDYEDFTVEIRGEGSDFKSVNTFVDSLKNASYTYADNKNATLAFHSVVLDSISADNSSTSNTSGFKVLLVYEPAIFDPNNSGVKLTIPSITSTRSQTEKPKSLFDTPEVQ